MTISELHNRPPRQKLLAGIALLLLVAACSSGIAAGINSLGVPFQTAFQTPANGTALADPANANLVVDPTIDPFNP